MAGQASLGRRVRAAAWVCVVVGLCWGAAHAAPKATFETLKIDLGKIRQGKIVETVIPIGNSGDQPLVILGVQTSCPCASTDLPAEEAKRTVAPGGRFELKVLYDSKDRFGEGNAGIVIKTNDPEQPLTIVELNLTVEALVLTMPDKGVFWGMVPRGEELSKDKSLLIFPGNGSKDIELLDIRMALPTMTVRADREPEKDGFRIRAWFRVAPDVPLGTLTNEVIARVRIGGEEATVKLPLKGDVVGDVLVMPQAIVCAPKLAYTQNQPLSEEGIIVRASREGDPMPEILGVVAVGPVRCVVHKNFKPDWGTKADRHIVEVRTAENAPAGAQSATVYIMTSSKDQPIVPVPIFFRMQPRVVVEPAQVVLEPAPNAPAEQRVVLKDATGAALAVKDLRFEADLVEARIDADKAADADHPAAVVIKATAVPAPERMGTVVSVVTDQPGGERVLIPVLIRAPQAAAPAAPAPVESK